MGYKFRPANLNKRRAKVGIGLAHVEPGISLPLTYEDFDEIITYKIVIRIIITTEIEQWIGCSSTNYI